MCHSRDRSGKRSYIRCLDVSKLGFLGRTVCKKGRDRVPETYHNQNSNASKVRHRSFLKKTKGSLKLDSPEERFDLGTFLVLYSFI